MFKTILLAAALLAAPLLPATVLAQDSSFPSKPLRIVVPYPAGGGTDFVARALAEHLAKALRQP
jgi:tripartite-type tricarboxylate transporter receptor subunit TctC